MKALIATAMIFMGAGYDTTSMTLAYMAHRQDCQIDDRTDDVAEFVLFYL